METHPPLGKTGTAAAFAATLQGTGRYWFEWGETQDFGRTTPPRTHRPSTRSTCPPLWPPRRSRIRSSARTADHGAPARRVAP